MVCILQRCHSEQHNTIFMYAVDDLLEQPTTTAISVAGKL